MYNLALEGSAQNMNIKVEKGIGHKQALTDVNNAGLGMNS